MVALGEAQPPTVVQPDGFVLRPDVRDDQNEGEVYNAPVIGIIYPPPDLRNIVDITAKAVARSGVEFETRILQREGNNPKFNFLKQGDPYHAYYEHKVGEFMRGEAPDVSIPARPYSPPASGAQATNAVQEKLRKQLEVVVLKDAPPEYEFLGDPPSISSFDLEVVKLTAQCVAKNGRDFLAELMDKESKNFQFDFLKPAHSLFDYFTKLVEQYYKVLLPQPSIVADLRKESQESRKILDAARYRAEWYRRDLREKERENEEHEKERVAYAQIDWHDFTVVETIDYQQWEEGEFPAPTTPEEVGARSLFYERMLQEQQQKQNKAAAAAPPAPEADDITVEMEIDEEEPRAVEPRREDAAPAVLQPPSSIPAPILNPAMPGSSMIIRPYNPKARPIKDAAPQPTEYVISSITGERIPVEKLQEHLKYNLLDPEFLEQRDRRLMEKTHQELVYAPGSSIGDSLKQLAERRSDIFGSGAEETSIGRKIGDQSREQEKKVVWDGFGSSSDFAQRAAAKTVTPEEQRKHDYEQAKFHGLIPDPEKDRIGPQTGGAAAAPPVVPVIAPPPVRLPVFAPPPVTPLPMMRPPAAPMGMSFLPPPPQQFIPPPMMPVMRPLAPPVSIAPPLPEPEDEEEDEPSAKRQKHDDKSAEEEYLRTHTGPVTFKVQVPHVGDKPEWKLNGQVLTLSLNARDSMTVLKGRIQDQLGIPVAKQKVQFDGVYVKDNQTMAGCSIVPGSVVFLQVKERGGRKK
ncbi:Splicing factor 3A subunit 1 [Hypsibius exemplaris]|uniref:Splicing factor 3A subunit 1 n=1 Tax=Hypsibius exemplaris TaxID=2072580 RepID=A0A1W0WBM9_HYPEX|nr:Splicing factor 3A subunit 1 [Hypsibius exemplaris]